MRIDKSLGRSTTHRRMADVYADIPRAGREQVIVVMRVLTAGPAVDLGHSFQLLAKYELHFGELTFNVPE